MNSTDISGKIKFSMFMANNDSDLEFLNLRLHVNEHNKICVHMCGKPTNSFTMFYDQLAIPKNIKKVPKEIVFSLRRKIRMKRLIFEALNTKTK